MTTELFLAVLSLALVVGAFLAAILPPDSRQRLRIILITTFVSFVLVSAIMIFQTLRREREIAAISVLIVAEVATEKTADELVEAIDPKRPALVYEALDRLTTDLRVQNPLADVEDKKLLPHKVRLYFLRH